MLFNACGISWDVITFYAEKIILLSTEFLYKERKMVCRMPYEKYTEEKLVRLIKDYHALKIKHNGKVYHVHEPEKTIKISDGKIIYSNLVFPIDEVLIKAESYFLY